MGETGKARQRRWKQGFLGQLMRGPGIDIGFGNDPVTPTCDKWDLLIGSGDATHMEGVPDDKYSWVYSSHVLEHLLLPHVAIQNWFRILKPGGHLLLFIPHRNLYEKRLCLPSRFNADHKTFWLIDRNEPPCTFGLVPFIGQYLKNYEIRLIQQCDWGHTIEDPLQHSDGEYSIECVIKKQDHAIPIHIN